VCEGVREGKVPHVGKGEARHRGKGGRIFLLVPIVVG